MTKHDILSKHCFYQDRTIGSVHKAMQEYSDAVLAEYKAKLKDEVKKRYSIPGNKFWYPTCAEIENLIDTTEI